MPQQTISISGQTLVAITANEHLCGTPVIFIHGITASIDQQERQETIVSLRHRCSHLLG